MSKENEFFKGHQNLSEHLAEETQKVLDEMGAKVKINMDKIKEAAGKTSKDNSQDQTINNNQDGFLI